MNKKTSIVSFKNINKVFQQGDVKLEVLKDITLDLYPGEIVAMVGASGSGKSTLLHIAGLLERPTNGDVILNGTSCWDLNDPKRTALRLNQVGFVYQFHHLLPEFTALENVMLPQIIQNTSKKVAAEKSMKLLTSLGLKERATHRPSRLSGGEQQRVAVLRALANDPQILFADEPTGNLDEKSAKMVFDELITLVRERKIAALIATHDLSLAKKMDRIFHLRHGVLKEEN
jgi:lipoprotein-releasing system ATP-binding protein